ncbi:MAG: carotenoid biosynthesis protein, partial [Anaerolineae bacterium]
MFANLKTGSLAGTRQNLPLMVLVAVYWALALLDPVELSGDAAEAVYYTQSLVWLAFVLVHGSRRYGWDNLFIFFGITFLVSWSIESVGIATGSPFGNYYYTDLLGARIGAVPLAVSAAYFVAGYLAWTLGTIFLGELGTSIEGKSLCLVPAIASLIMVMWDLCFDPIKSTIERAWVWEDGG